MCFGHYNPKDFYESVFTLSSQYGYSILDIERMYPFELNMMVEWLVQMEKEKEKERAKAKKDILRIPR